MESDGGIWQMPVARIRPNDGIYKQEKTLWIKSLARKKENVE